MIRAHALLFLVQRHHSDEGVRRTTLSTIPVDTKGRRETKKRSLKDEELDLPKPQVRQSREGVMVVMVSIARRNDFRHRVDDLPANKKRRKRMSPWQWTRKVDARREQANCVSAS